MSTRIAKAACDSAGDQATFDLEFLFASARELVELSFGDDLYEFIAGKLQQLVPGAYVLVSSIDGSRDCFVLQAARGFDSLLPPIQELLGRRLRGITTPVSDDALAAMTGTGLVHGPKGIFELAGGSMPAAVCAALEKLLKIGDIYSIGFTHRGRLFGSAVIVTRKGAELRRKEPIVAFINQAAVALKRRQAEEELRNLDMELEKRVEERTSQLREALGELETFAYSVSHDLKTPLYAIAGFQQILKEQLDERLSDEEREVLSRIGDAAGDMAHLINALLALSKATKAPLERVRVDLSSAVRGIVQDLQASERGRSVEVVIEDGVWADGDPRLLPVALSNLLDNAWKFTARTPKATIEFGTATRAGRAEYFVRDNGAGFDAAKAGKLFKPFRRFHSSSEFEGSGIGLATVKRIVERHGGDIRCESAPGAGAAFFFTLSAPGDVR